MTEPLPDTTTRPAPRDHWWKGDGGAAAPDCHPAPREGMPCPSCLLGELNFNGLFQLICDTCGRVAEAAVFT